MRSKIIAVDFDGTLCDNAWPEIGAPRQAVIDYVREQQQRGAKLILWTNRCGEYLTDAVRWCGQHGIAFDAVNANLPEMIEYFQNDCRKVFADEYIDDRAIPLPETVAPATETARSLCFIKKHLGRAELLAQLAEESAELAQAALKYRRVLTGANPTPVSEEKAVANLLEEMADVELCVALLSATEDGEKKLEIQRYKAARWVKRLDGAQ